MAPRCAPASQFCCGCSVKFGVMLWLVYHLLQNVSTVINILGPLVAPAKENGFGQGASSDRASQAALGFFALAGLPLIVMALVGVRYRNEPLVRLYFLYMVLSAVLDWTLIAKKLLFSGCNNVPKALEEQGHAFACGITRDMNMTIVFLLTIIQLYLLWIVWSYCQDLAEGGEGPELSDLAVVGAKRQGFGPGFSGGSAYGGSGYGQNGSYGFAGGAGDSSAYGAMDGMMEEHAVGNRFGGIFGTIYDKAAGNGGLGGGKPMFHGRFHEMQYPPPL